MIDRDNIEKLARLAKIRLSESDLERLRSDIDAIVEHVSEIRSVVGRSEGRNQPGIGERCNIFREDGEPHSSGVFSDMLLEVAPRREGRFIKVKKIL